MPLINSEIDDAKLAILRSLESQNQPLHVYELVAVYWQPPDRTIYYSCQQVDQFEEAKTIPVGPVEARFPASISSIVDANVKCQFVRNVTLSYDIADSSVDLPFDDIDLKITNLYARQGEGVKVEIFYWFPQAQWLLSRWHGHLVAPQNVSGGYFQATAESGFRSGQLVIPKRPIGYGGCYAIFAGLFATQRLADESPCGYDFGFGGSQGIADPSTGLAWTFCPALVRGDCIARFGDDKQYYGIDTVVHTYPSFPKANLFATSVGNENNLQNPLRVIAGVYLVRGLDILAYSIELGNKDPADGSISLIYGFSEGSVGAASIPEINGVNLAFDHYQIALGARRQLPTTFAGGTANNYSNTAHFLGIVKGAFTDDTAVQQQGQIQVDQGFSQVHIYSDQTNYTLGYTNNTADWLLELYTNTRFGNGVDPQRFAITDITTPQVGSSLKMGSRDWCNQTVNYTDATGATATTTRSTFNADVSPRPADQIIRDLCVYSRLCPPIIQNGLLRFPYLGLETIDSDVPYFTDIGSGANICVDKDGIPMVEWSQQSDRTLVNEIRLNFIDALNQWINRPLIFGDRPQQFKAGKAAGDTTIKINPATHSAFGITDFGQAVRCGNYLLHLGPLDSGGISNNLTVTITTWFSEALPLYTYQLVRCHTRKTEPIFQNTGFEYFRVISKKETSDMKTKLTLQAYNVPFMMQMENGDGSGTVPPIGGSGGGGGNPGGPTGGGPFETPFDTFDFTDYDESGHFLVNLEDG